MRDNELEVMIGLSSFVVAIVVALLALAGLLPLAVAQPIVSLLSLVTSVSICVWIRRNSGW